MALPQNSHSKIFPVPPKGSAMNKQELTKAPRKIYIPIKIQTNAIKKDDIAINATYMSMEDLTSEEDRKKARQRAKTFEVRYMENIRMLRDKIKSSYSCNKDHCPAVKERLVKHQLEHHSSTPTPPCQPMSRTVSGTNEKLLKVTDTENAPMGAIRLITAEPHISQPVSISAKQSILKCRNNPKNTENQAIQTTPNNVDFCHTTQSHENNNLFKSDGHTNLKHTYLEINDYKPKETKISFTSKNCVMKEDLQNEIMTWYDDIPVYPNLNPSPKNSKRAFMNEFVEKIYSFTNEENTVDEYENKVRNEIENLLITLPIWYPGAKREQEELKDNIKNNLLVKIRDLRGKMYDDKSVDVQTDDLYETEVTKTQTEKEHIAKLIENEILDWVMQIKFKESEDIGRTIKIIDTTDIFARRLMPVLNRTACTRNCKLILKGLILDTLNDLPNIIQFPKNKRVYLNRIAEELANRLLYIQVKCRNSGDCCAFLKNRKLYRMAIYNNNVMKKSLVNGFDYCLGNCKLYPRFNVIEDVTDILLDCINSVALDGIHKSDEVSVMTQNSTETTETQASVAVSDVFEVSVMTQNSMETTETQASVTVSDAYVESIRDTLTENIIDNAPYSNANINRHNRSGTVSVFKSEHDFFGRSGSPVTSTPKRKPTKKEVAKQNPEEITYTNKVCEIIRDWMETLPKTFNEDKKFKNTVVTDLAGDIVDQLKTEQLVPIDPSDKNKLMYYTIFRWLYRFDIFEDELSEEVPQIRDLQKRLDRISAPILTRPRHGNRQAIAAAKIKESDRDFFVPKGMDVLEDEISIWVNEQPSNIYSKGDNDRNKMIHELANGLQNRLKNKNTDLDINNDIANWMNKMLKTSEKRNINQLTDSLKRRIIKLPQDDTLKQNLHQKIQWKLEAEAARYNPEQDPAGKNPISSPFDIDPDRTMKEFIAKYMEHNYDVDDTVAREAFAELLKTEIRKLSPPTRKEVYESFTKPLDEFSPDRLDKELQYIKIVSDWLKNIPIDSSFNTPHNKKRIDIVNDLARNIYEVEEERRRAPTAMDYDIYLASIISQFTNELPIPPVRQGDVMFMIDELIGRVKAERTPMPCCQNANQTLSSTNTTGIQEQSISEFIHNYIHLNAGEFADDQVKMDAWSARLMKELKKIIQSTADPSTLCKTQVYSKLISVPIPEDESIRLFGLELGYAKEISDWLRNMPLLHFQTQEANVERVKMISELAEKFSERDRKRIADPLNQDNNTEIEEFITYWIKRLPLEQNKEIDIPILIKQLLRRIDKVNKGQETPTLEPAIANKQSPVKINKNKKKYKSRSKTQRCRPSCCSSGKGQPGQILVDAIEKWSNNLPLKSGNEDTDKTFKDDVARKLYQKVGNLSVDPQIMNNDNLFQELFTDEVTEQLKSVSQSPDIEKKKDALKNDLVEKVMEAKSIIKETVAGDNYKLQLENTIEASFPTPKTNKKWYDPGFEIYKNRLADNFILDNFDHGNDAVKNKYERKIRDEVDKYCQSAQNRNAIPLSKDEIYNELYSALFKVPIPNEVSAIAEVEEVKTRCEIDIWYEGLPLREVSSLTEQLEFDQILTMLAKRLHAIETSEQNPDEKLHKEIAKWVIKLPLIQGQESNADRFADELIERLKATKDNRKCVTSSGKGKNIKKGPKRKESRSNKSQVAGPSNEDQVRRVSRSQPCCKVSEEPRKKPAELVLEIVESWCDQIPLPLINPEDAINNKIIRDNLLSQIIIKICALNGSSKIFNDTILYDHFLDAELDILLSEVPICCQFEQTKNAKKTQLVKSILSLLPLMREERACYEYKQELKTTINHVLEEPLDTTAEKIAEFNQLKNEIVDNFVQYHYNRDDDEGKQIYKANLHEIVSKYLQDIRDKADDSPVDPLIKQNQLLCELAKVPIPCERVIKDEVEEIKMKDEINEFFDELALPDDSEEKMTLRQNIKLSLAKRIHQIEKTGHNCENDSKIKKEISRYLKKINVEISPDKINAFVDKLKNNEAIRKSPPIENKAFVSRPKQNTLNYSRDKEASNARENFELRECGTNQNSVESTPLESQDIGGDTASCIPLAHPYQQRRNSVSIQSSNRENPAHQPKGYAQGQRRNKAQGPDSNEEADNEDCECERRMKRKYRGRPRCVLRLDDCCEECEQFRHLWLPMPYRMPPPRYYYY